MKCASTLNSLVGLSAYLPASVKQNSECHALMLLNENTASLLQLKTSLNHWEALLEFHWSLNNCGINCRVRQITVRFDMTINVFVQLTC